MALWLAATAGFFAYIALIAAFMPGVPAPQRKFACAGAAGGLLAAVAASAMPRGVLTDWIVPPLFLVAAYWTSGLLFVAPMPRVERALLGVDSRLRVGRISAAAPGVVAEFLECAYAAVYAVIPIALGIYLTRAPAPDASRFWAVILITDYICFAMLPWIQTRPPRALEAGEPWKARFRAFNLRLLGSASIHVNTFPSGHAAEGLAAALMVAGAPAPILISMMLSAVAISAGAVLGRYHYAADAVAGWAVALAVWLFVMKG